MRNKTENTDIKLEEMSLKRHYDVRANLDVEDTPFSDICGSFLTFFAVLIILCTFPFSLFICLEVIKEYERIVIFRHGRLREGGIKGPGVIVVIPCIDSYRLVDLRTVSFGIQSQRILSKDTITVEVEAVVYYSVINATIAVCNVFDYANATRLLTSSSLRNVFGTKTLSEILANTFLISEVIKQQMESITGHWGVRVDRVDIKNVSLPVQLQRTMAAEAEAYQEARAKVIDAEGELKASHALVMAGDILLESPAAIHLRYLQTMTSIGAENNHTIVFPFPTDCIEEFIKKHE